MAFKIIWTENANEGLFAILNYLKNKWSISQSDKFLENLYLIFTKG
jgi:plasmid stabilization system protein ParE